MGFGVEQFRRMPNGANGYKHMLKYEDISVLYDGAENMGIHVNITGSSIALLLETYQKKNRFENPFGNTDELIEKRKQGKIVSKWKKSRNDEEHVVADNEKVGHTVYFGSRKSDILMRVYEKKLEHNKNLSVDDEDYRKEDWIRWELELHKGRADKIAELLSNGYSIGEVAIGALSNYFRIINLDNNHKSRCSSEEKWQRFVSNVNKLRITVEKEPKSIEEEMEQFEKQQGRKFAKYCVFKGGDIESIMGFGERFMCKLTQQDYEQLGLA